MAAAATRVSGENIKAATLGQRKIDRGIGGVEKRRVEGGGGAENPLRIVYGVPNSGAAAFIERETGDRAIAAIGLEAHGKRPVQRTVRAQCQISPSHTVPQLAVETEAERRCRRRRRGSGKSDGGAR